MMYIVAFLLIITLPTIFALAWLIVPGLGLLIGSALGLFLGSDEVTFDDANYFWAIIGGIIGLIFSLYVMSHS